MPKFEQINHAGIVERITPETIHVSITVASQCAACHAKGFCSVADVAEKKIAVPNHGQPVEEGETVMIILQSGLALTAVWWAYLFPLLLLLIILLFLHNQNISDLYSGLFALGGIAIYYGILWLFKDKFKKKYTFVLEKITK